MIHRSVQRASVTPKLWRTFVIQHTSQTLTLVAQLAPVPPQNMGRANQPVFMRFVNLKALPHRQQAGTPDERGIVVPDYVRFNRGQNFAYAGRVHDGSAKLLGQQVRDHAIAAAQPDPLDAVRIALGLRFAAKDQVTVLVVDNGDVVAACHKCPGHSLDANCITSEGIRRIKCREHQNAQRLHANCTNLPMTFRHETPSIGQSKDRSLAAGRLVPCVADMPQKQPGLGMP